MSCCNSNAGDNKGAYSRNMLVQQKLLQNTNNYCTSRTINEPRDVYNTQWFDYGTFLPKYAHAAIRDVVHPMNGHVGCLGCNSDKPTCPQKSGLAYPSHIGVESRLKGL